MCQQLDALGTALLHRHTVDDDARPPHLLVRAQPPARGARQPARQPFVEPGLFTRRPASVEVHERQLHRHGARPARRRAPPPVAHSLNIHNRPKDRRAQRPRQRQHAILGIRIEHERLVPLPRRVPGQRARERRLPRPRRPGNQHPRALGAAPRGRHAQLVEVCVQVHGRAGRVGRVGDALVVGLALDLELAALPGEDLGAHAREGVCRSGGELGAVLLS